MLRIEELGTSHDRKGFDCGNDALNAFLKTLARQHQGKGISKTFVLVGDSEPGTILGFFALTVCEVASEDLPQEFAGRYPSKAPGAKLARLAVDKRHQGKRYGQILMFEAMKKTVMVAEQVGIIGFFVDAKSDDARKYYEQFGFISFPARPLEMFLPLHTLRRSIALLS